MEEETEPVVTLENAGKGLAFLGMVIFVAYALLYLMSRAQPEFFNLFGREGHFVAVSITCILLVLGGYALTKIKPKPDA